MMLLAARGMAWKAALVRAAPWYAAWFDHPDHDAYWREISPSEHYDSMTTP
jgi:predicted acyl esterase